MDISIVLALIALAMITVNDFIYGMVSRSADIRQILGFYMISSILSFVVIFVKFETTSLIGTGVLALPNSKELIYGAVMGVVAVITYMLYLLSFSSRGNSPAAVIVFRLNLIPSIILSVIFLGENLTVYTYIAIALCIIAILILKEKNGDHTNNKKLFLAFGACLGAGLLNMINKGFVISGGVTSEGLLFTRCAVVMVFSVIAPMVMRNKVAVPKRIVAFGSISGVLLTVEILLVLSALKTGMVSIVIPITQLTFVFVSVYSMVVYKEKFVIKKIAAAVVAIVSIIMISIK